MGKGNFTLSELAIPLIYGLQQKSPNSSYTGMVTEKVPAVLQMVLGIFVSLESFHNNSALHEHRVQRVRQMNWQVKHPEFFRTKSHPWRYPGKATIKLDRRPVAQNTTVRYDFIQTSFLGSTIDRIYRRVSELPEQGRFVRDSRSMLALFRWILRSAQRVSAESEIWLRVHPCHQSASAFVPLLVNEWVAC